MIRLFEEHQVRKTTELSSSLWDFRPVTGENAAPVQKVTVPSCWETYPGFEAYRGQGLYERTFEAGGDVRLVFKGVSHTATVSVDGTVVAEHYNAFTPFEAILTDLTPGVHKLSVLVDNSFSEASALHVENDYQSYGGISRGVVLEQLSKHYIKQMHFTPVYKDGRWYAQLEIVIASLDSEPWKGSVRVSLKGGNTANETVLYTENCSTQNCSAENSNVENGSTENIDAANESVIKSDLIACENVTAWAPEHPTLYLLTAQLFDTDGAAIDDLTDRVGFREVKVQGKDILLNGRKLRIKGFCRHEDHPQFGCALPLSAIMQDLQLARDCGANSIRTSHYPNDELFLDLCDELGILVWEENHARGLSEAQMKNPNFERQCEDCIREMIAAHYNHPSIYIWGILNECASDTEYGKSCYKTQFELIGSLDPSRPHSFSSCRFKTDICFDLVDIVSYNIYPKWYHNTPVADYLDDLYKWVQTTEGAGKPFLITEVGAGAIYGYRTPAKVKWSEEYQVQALEEQLNAILSYGDCSGVYIWQFCDVRVTNDWWSTRPRTMNNKGIVDEYRRPKLSYETVKHIFSSVDTYRD